VRNEENDASRAVSGWIGRLITAPCRPYQPGEIDAEANGAEARRIGSQIAVLLKNDQEVLPLDAHAGSVVISGQSAFVDDASLGGGGSSKVTALYTVAPLDGMRNVLDGLGSAAMVTKVTVADDLSNLDEAKQAAADADVVVPRGWWPPRAPTRRIRTCSTTRTACSRSCWASTRPRSWCSRTATRC
jgi:beta-glucosidase-like glycosyl hydrolase